MIDLLLWENDFLHRVMLKGQLVYSLAYLIQAYYHKNQHVEQEQPPIHIPNNNHSVIKLTRTVFFLLTACSNAKTC